MKIIPAIIILLVVNLKASSQTDFNQVQTTQNDFDNFLKSGGITRHENGVGAIPTFTPREETVGNRYLFQKWVKGTVTNKKDTVFNNPSFLFNYDKVSQLLIMTQDRNIYIELYKDQIQSFTLEDGDKNIQFKKIPSINPNDFFELLSKDVKGYSLYKSIQTKFIKADFHTNGISESGNKYDEYKDEFTYYIVKPDGKNFSKVSLKKKSIREGLAGNETKLDSFFALHKDAEITEDTLVELIDTLNAGTK